MRLDNYCANCRHQMKDFQTFAICFHSENIWKLLQGSVEFKPQVIEIVPDPAMAGVHQ